MKLELYQRRDVLEYWLVDPDRATIVIYRRSPAATFELATEHLRANADSVTSPLLPGFEVALEKLFR